MAPGIFSAFAQVGRKVPPVDDIGAPAASLVYWKQHDKSGYKGSGVAIPAIKDGTYSMAVALAMLQGRRRQDHRRSLRAAGDHRGQPEPVDRAGLDGVDQCTRRRPAVGGADHLAA